ncbi:hypothetical protein [Sphingomonas aurantiaca]|uniref:hypothetical protein n=1 Tax=Sphingomonas aurantiaca TaxID=185949 RepID=UPI00335391FC
MIGIADATLADFNAWKRDILFFDKIFVASSRSAVAVLRKLPFGDRENNAVRADELEFLLESDHFISRSDTALEIIRQSDDADLAKKFRPLVDRYDQLFADTKAALDGFTDWEDFEVRASEPNVRASHRLRYTIGLQLEAAYQQSQGVNAMLHGTPAWMRAATGSLDPQQALELTLSNVPVPADTVPWEEIFAIKNDPEILHRARKLQLWVHEAAKPGMTVERLNQYIQDSISDYESYMKANRIRFRSSIMKTAVVGTAELFEDILHARVGKIAARLFSVQEKQADFLLAEARAPGRQLSLITTLREKLRTEA